VILQAAPLEQRERLNLLGYLLTSADLPLRPRVAAIIVLLYAQPLSRVARLTIDDVVHDGDQVLLRLGDPPSPLPAPVADLLLTWIDNRDNMNSAANHHSRWLFPGHRAGQPMHSDTLAALVGNLGIPPPLAGPALSASTSWKCSPRSSPRPSATIPSPQPNSPPNLEAPGAGTPQETTHGHQQAGLLGELATAEYASPTSYGPDTGLTGLRSWLGGDADPSWAAVGSST